MTSDGTNSFTWDARDHLASMNAGIETFEYDPFGRHVTETISGVTTNFLYDGINPVQELSGTTVTANLLTGLGVDEYFTRTDAAGARNFLTDALGSTVALADSTGTIQTSYSYGPFGNTTTSGQSNGNPYQYTGRENDGTGLYFYRVRYYSPTLQRFASEDPLRLLAGTVNFYAYAHDNPIGVRDPLGLCGYPGDADMLPPVGPHTPLPPMAGRKPPSVDPVDRGKQKCLNKCLEYEIGCETVCLALNFTLPPPAGEVLSAICTFKCGTAYGKCLDRCTH